MHLCVCVCVCVRACVRACVCVENANMVGLLSTCRYQNNTLTVHVHKTLTSFNESFFLCDAKANISL